jgi:hypothetical protein
MEPIQDDIETVRALPYCTRYGVRLPLDEFTTAVGYTAHNECPPQRHVYIVEPAALDRLVAERDRLQAQVESLQAQVESLREERELDVRVATWEVRFNALEAERDRLKEKADYWERQYVIESENADDFHAERDRLLAGIGALVEDIRADMDANVSHVLIERLEALTPEERS